VAIRHVLARRSNLESDASSGDRAVSNRHESCSTDEMTLKTARVVYWVATLLFVLPQAWSAVQYLTQAPRMVETFTQLGYPPYVMTFLAVAKVLGIAAVLWGRPALLKEWAYAGFTFDTLGAAWSHFSARDPWFIVAVPLAFMLVQFVSYAMWKRAGDSVSLAARLGGRAAPRRRVAERRGGEALAK
jgi:hypothetical protein